MGIGKAGRLRNDASIEPQISFRPSPKKGPVVICGAFSLAHRPTIDIVNRPTAPPLDSVPALREIDAQPGEDEMAADIEIKCINKTDRMNPHERIKNIGGVNADGSRWNLPLDQAIAGIKAGKWRFWTAGGGKSVWVAIAKTGQGHEYLKTEADGVQPDNLLALPQCP